MGLRKARGFKNGTAPWRGKRALVIGVSGFLGGWIARQLVDAGANVVGLSRTKRPQSQLALTDLADRIELVAGDAADADQIARCAQDAHAIFQCASLADVSRALREPTTAFHDSVGPTLAALEFVRTRQPTTTLIVTSSDKAYGPQPPPFRETLPLQPQHPYEVAKAAQDLLAQSFAKIYGLNVAVTRCGNFFGPYDFSFERVIPYTIRQFVRSEPPILRSNGKATRDFLYIEEAARAHLLLAEQLAIRPELRGEVFNFSHEVSVPVRDIISRIAQIMGTKIAPRIAGDAKAEIADMRLDCTKASNLLAWSPAEFDVYLARTVDWYCEYFRHEAAAAKADIRCGRLCSSPPTRRR